MAANPTATFIEAGRPAFLKLRHGAYVKVDRIGYAGIRIREDAQVWEVFVVEDPRRPDGSTGYVVDESLSPDAAQAALDTLMRRIAKVVT